MSVLKELEAFLKEHCSVVSNIVTFPKLFSLNKKGKIRFWQGFVLIPTREVPTERGAWLSQCKKAVLPEAYFRINTSRPAVAFTQSGQEEGKILLSDPKIVSEGKNEGRSNATNPFQQALFEVWSDFKKRMKKGSKLRVEELVSEASATFAEICMMSGSKPWRVSPMQYHTVDKYWNKVKFPCFAQTKLDGTHFIAVGVPDQGIVDFYPRGLTKETKHNHIIKALSFLLEKKYYSWYVCGELYKAGLERQDMASNANKEKEASEIKLEFHVFDAFSPDHKLGFADRWKFAQEIIARADSAFIKSVETVCCETREELETFYQEKIKAGEEGIIIKNLDGLYEYGITHAHRSFQALKYKPRQDAEFEIVGFKEGEGKMAGQIIFQAKTKEGKTFWVAPKWTEEVRRKVFAEQSKEFTLKNRFATIQFDIYSKDKIPQQPQLIRFIEQ